MRPRASLLWSAFAVSTAGLGDELNTIDGRTTCTMTQAQHADEFRDMHQIPAFFITKKEIFSIQIITEQPMH